MKRISPLLRTRRFARGFSIVEVMSSFTIFVIAIVGVTQLQIVAASANSLSRKRMQAQQIAAQVSAAVQYWQFNDSRMAASSTVTGRTSVATPVSINSITEAINTPMDFALGDYAGARTRNQRQTPLGATDPTLPGSSIDSQFRVYWTVTGEDKDSDGILDSKLISIVVRWQEGNTWKNLNTAQARFNVAILRPNYN